MIRRSLRIGVRLGLLAGLAFALVKVLGSRSHRGPSATPGAAEPWPPLVTDPSAPSRVAPLAAVADEAVVVPDVAPAKEASAKKSPAKEAPAKKPALAKTWVEPEGTVCPTTHPVKAKLASKIFHLPGFANYERTKPDRCYADQPTAEADGLRAAKR